MLSTVVVSVAGVIGVFVLLDCWVRREIKRDMDRLIFPHFHENRMLRERLKELEGEQGREE